MPESIITKRCCTCKTTKPVFEFYKNRSTKDGFQTACKSCQTLTDKTESRIIARRRYRKRYKKTAKGKEAEKRERKSQARKDYRKQYKRSDIGKAASKRYRESVCGKATARQSSRKQAALYPEKIKARNAINNAVNGGRFPTATQFICSCGEQAKQYHHHLGYAKEHWFDVVPVCIPCHTATCHL